MHFEGSPANKKMGMRSYLVDDKLSASGSYTSIEPNRGEDSLAFPEQVFYS